MFFYQSKEEVRVGDQVLYGGSPGYVEQMVIGEDVSHWDLEEPGFLINCEKYGRIHFSKSSLPWEDLDFVKRGVSNDNSD